MMDVLARSELAKYAIYVFNIWNAREFDQKAMDDAVNALCLQAQRDPQGIVANTTYTQIMSALFYSYNLLHTLSAVMPNEDLEAYGTWCTQVESWMGANDKSGEGIFEDAEQVSKNG